MCDKVLGVGLSGESRNYSYEIHRTDLHLEPWSLLGTVASGVSRAEGPEVSSARKFWWVGRDGASAKR